MSIIRRLKRLDTDNDGCVRLTDVIEVVSGKGRWSLLAAQELVSRLWDDVFAAGYLIGLSGGVLYRGHSNQDCDLVLYPRTVDNPPGPDMGAVLVAFAKADLRFSHYEAMEPHRLFHFDDPTNGPVEVCVLGLEVQEAYDRLTGLMHKRFPPVGDTFPDWKIEDIVTALDAVEQSWAAYSDAASAPADDFPWVLYQTDKGFAAGRVIPSRNTSGFYIETSNGEQLDPEQVKWVAYLDKVVTLIAGVGKALRHASS